MAKKAKGTTKFCGTCDRFVRPTQTPPRGRCPLRGRSLKSMEFVPDYREA